MILGLRLLLLYVVYYGWLIGYFLVLLTVDRLAYHYTQSQVCINRIDKSPELRVMAIKNSLREKKKKGGQTILCKQATRLKTLRGIHV